MRPCIEDRRNKGWGKVSGLKGIISELPEIRRVEIGLKLREAKVHNGILYNSEAWSNKSDVDIERLKQVSAAALTDPPSVARPVITWNLESQWCGTLSWSED